MKKLTFLFALLMMVFTSSSKSDCGDLTDSLCTWFNDITKKMNQCNSMEDLKSLILDYDIQSVNFQEVTPECMESRLTEGEKEKLKEACTNYWNTFSDKLVSLSGGRVNQEEARQQVQPVLDYWYEGIDKSHNFKEFNEFLNQY